jgi:hypothetical protein
MVLPGWVITLAAIAMGVVIAGILVLVGQALAQQRDHKRLISSLEDQIAGAIQAIESGQDFGDVVTRCYAEMVKVLLEERGLAREQAMTPQEFIEMLVNYGFPIDPLHSLTHIFEEVRYGHVAPSAEMMQTALTSLAAIQQHCQATAGTA